MQKFETHATLKRSHTSYIVTSLDEDKILQSSFVCCEQPSDFVNGRKTKNNNSKKTDEGCY